MAPTRERRSVPRSPAQRQAAFVAVDGSSLLQTGTVVEISSAGLRMITRQPPQVGKIIELELEPRSDSPHAKPALVRGRVVHIQSIGSGEYSVGVRLRYRVTPAHAVATPQPAAGLPYDIPAVHTSSWRNALRQDWRALSAAVALLLLLALLLLAWPEGTQRAKQQFNGGNSLASAATDAPRIPRRPPAPPPDASSSGGGSAMNDEVVAGESDTAIRNLRLDRARKQADALLRTTGIEPLPDDGAAASLSHNDDGMVHFGPVSSRASSVDAKAETMPESAMPADALQVAAAPLNLADLLKPKLQSGPERTSGTSEAGSGDNGVQLVVNKAAFQLTVYRDGKAFAEFPVSLGAEDSTPNGQFTIYNKLRNPDWYNKGETVPHGDPRNPLGASWMGFAKDGQPVSYGIHPVTDADRVGKANSKGCVCLTPNDAETLFRLIPIGATVTIR